MDVKVSGQGRQTLRSTNDINGINLEGNRTNIEIKNAGNVKTSEQKPVSVDQAKRAVDKVNKILEDKTTHVEYDEDKDFKSVMIMKVVDNKTNEILREIPSKQIMDLIDTFAEMAGLVIDKKV